MNRSDSVATYFIMRIKHRHDVFGLEDAQTYYLQIFNIGIYGQHKTQVNAALIEEGYDECIVEIV